jgi:hypothetical protein
MEQQQQPPARNLSRSLHHGNDGGIISPDGTRSEDSSLTLPLTGTSPTTSSSSEGPTSPPGANDSVFDHDTSKSPAVSNDVDALRQLLQEVIFSAECFSVYELLFNVACFNGCVNLSLYYDILCLSVLANVLLRILACACGNVRT